MEEYLRAREIFILLQERQFILKCRMQFIDLRVMRPWKYSDFLCFIFYNDESKRRDRISYFRMQNKYLTNNKPIYIPLHSDQPI